MNPVSNNFPVIVIGAGLAGLAAAVHLAERGMEPLVLEADRIWSGGRLAGGEDESFMYQGKEWIFTPEHGVHALWGGYVNMRAMIEQFTATQLQPSAGEEWINRWGREVRRMEAGNAIRSRWIPAPFHYLQLLFSPQIWAAITPLDFLSLPGVLTSILLTVGVDPLREKRPWDGLLLKDFFNLWTPNLRTTFEGLATNLLAAPKDQISLAGFIAALRFYTMLRRDSWQMHYFHANAQSSVIQPLQKRLEESGGAIYNGVTALGLERSDNGWRIRVEDSRRGGYGTFHADHVILATDPEAAKRILHASPDTQPQAETIFFPEGVGNATVRLWFASAPHTAIPGGMMTGDFAPDNFFWLHLLYDDHRQWHAETGGSTIELHYYDETVYNQPDRNLIITSVTEIQRAFPEVSGDFIHATVRRNSKVHPRFRIPTDEMLHVRTPWQQVYACGDWIGYDTPALWMERSTVTGIAAANEVLKAHGKEPFAILTPPAPEITVRVLGAIVRAGRFLLAPLITGLLRLLHPLRQGLRKLLFRGKR